MDQMKLNSDGDLDLTDGDGYGSWIGEVEAVSQHNQIRLNYFLEEFELEMEEGFPFYQLIAGKKNKRLATFLIKKRILDTPDMDSVSKINYIFEKSTRNLRVDWSGKSSFMEQNINRTNYIFE
jgi:hypothetical protein